MATDDRAKAIDIFKSATQAYIGELGLKVRSGRRQFNLASEGVYIAFVKYYSLLMDGFPRIPVYIVPEFKKLSQWKSIFEDPLPPDVVERVMTKINSVGSKGSLFILFCEKDQHSFMRIEVVPSANEE